MKFLPFAAILLGLPFFFRVFGTGEISDALMGVGLVSLGVGSLMNGGGNFDKGKPLGSAFLVLSIILLSANLVVVFLR